MGKARRIAIVGAGLGGLAAAIALRQQGFEVQVFEQASELAEFGAGINISPNSVRFFQAVGLADKLHAVASEPTGLSWRDWRTAEIRYLLPFGDFEKRYGAKYYVVHRSDLHRLLSEAVPQADIQLGQRCTQVELRKGAVGLSFENGRSVDADVVVGCDGIRSAVRACIFGGEGPHYAGTMCWRALAPSDALPKDYHDRHVNQWSGEGGFVISYLIRQGSFINFVAVRQQPGWAEPSWSVPSSVDEMLAAFPDTGEKLRTMMSKATSCSKWGQFTGEHAPRWTKGRVTLLGDSAHAMLATFGQGANMAFEDAYVLGQWLKASADNPDAALAGYESVRKPRATRVQQLSRTEVRFKKLHSDWDRLRREAVFLTRHGSTTSGVYRWIFDYDPVRQWRSL
jgi:2-polyprenyl-6-methoxyphenol hydroxylase-like FAD-dependent oxidoreductase